MRLVQSTHPLTARLGPRSMCPSPPSPQRFAPLAFSSSPSIFASAPQPPRRISPLHPPVVIMANHDATFAAANEFLMSDQGKELMAGIVLGVPLGGSPDVSSLSPFTAQSAQYLSVSVLVHLGPLLVWTQPYESTRYRHPLSTHSPTHFATRFSHLRSRTQGCSTTASAR